MRQFRVLLVDDEERILHFLRSKLKASGYEVLTATNGLEALEQVQAQEPDLMVLDLLMPKMNGFGTLKELRSFSTIPVIILSAKGADTDKIKGLELGADDYLAKPFNPDELVARIEAVRRRLTSWPSIMIDLKNAGANWVDEPVVKDGNLITSRKPADLPRFNKAIIEALI